MIDPEMSVRGSRSSTSAGTAAAVAEAALGALPLALAAGPWLAGATLPRTLLVGTT